MKTTILTENTAMRMCGLAEWGIAIHIEFGGKQFLFDTGQTDVFIKNAQMLNIDLQNLDRILISHRHRDHIGGLFHFQLKKKIPLTFHPEVLNHLEKTQNLFIQDNFKLELSKSVFEFESGAFFLGEIPITNDFEHGTYKGERISDDTALAFVTEKGTVVITGCSHSGIVNICDYAKKVTGQKLYAVLGGFHLFEENTSGVDGALDYFENEQVEQLFPMHCVDFPTLNQFRNRFGVKKLDVGAQIEL